MLHIQEVWLPLETFQKEFPNDHFQIKIGNMIVIYQIRQEEQMFSSNPHTYFLLEEAWEYIEKQN